MKFMNNIWIALGVLLLIAGGYYLYNKRRQNVKIQLLQNASSGINSVSQQLGNVQSKQANEQKKDFALLVFK